MDQLDVIPGMRTTFAQGVGMINGGIAGLNPLLTYGTHTSMMLEQLDETDGIVTFHTKSVSSMPLSETDLTRFVPLSYIL